MSGQGLVSVRQEKWSHSPLSPGKRTREGDTELWKEVCIELCDPYPFIKLISEIYKQDFDGRFEFPFLFLYL